MLNRSRSRRAPAIGPAALALVVLMLQGCATLLVRGDLSDAEREQIALETEPYLRTGTGSISGVVRIETGYGPFVAGRNNQVTLTPATTIASARFEQDVVEDNELPEQRKAEHVVFAQTNAAGRFRFDRLPPGEYLLVSPVRWSPTGHGDDAHSEVTYARVTLAEGEQADVVLTRAVEE